MGLTAIGKADIFATLRPKNEWDICAGTCLINEAGGKVINLNGDKITFKNRKTYISQDRKTMTLLVFVVLLLSVCN